MLSSNHFAMSVLTTQPRLLAAFGVLMLGVACDRGEAPAGAPPVEAAPAATATSRTSVADAVHVLTERVGDGAADDPGDATALTASGTVASDQLARPSSKTGGLLSAVLVREGDDVRRGQVIARIDATELAAGVAQAEAALEKARRDLARVEALFADSVATRTQRDDAATGVTVAERRLEAVRFNRERNVVTAPIGGRVVQKLANAGETVGPGVPVAVIQGTAPEDWRVRVGLTDAQWAGTRVGQAATVTLDAFPGETYPARLTERATAADPASGTFPVELQLLRQPPSLAAGLVAEVAFGAPAAGDAVEASAAPLTIPVSALGRVAGKRGEVFVAEGGVARAREVLLGSLRGGRAEVLSGLAAGEEVIVTGVAWLREGDAVIRSQSTQRDAESAE